MQAHDDLSTLFSRNLTFDNSRYIDPVSAAQTQEVPRKEPVVYSISQHYHHSAHIGKPTRAASEPSTDQVTTEIILARHGVDVSTLFPSQLDLFKTADPSQQMRLVELWRISPPNYGGHALTQDVSHQATSFEQEEALAKRRYERQMLEERASRSSDDTQQHFYDPEDLMSDSEQSNAPLTPIQTGDSCWSHTGSGPEPYMMSGYEKLARAEYEVSAQRAKESYSHFGSAVGGPSYSSATDPVYKSITSSWMRSPDEQQLAMENQYGAYTQNREYSYNDGVGLGADDVEML